MLIYNYRTVLLTDKKHGLLGTLQYLLQAVDDEGDTILFSLENTTYSIGIPSLSSDGM
jgi:hypothetical protein